MDRTHILFSVFVIISYAALCCSWDPNNVYLYDYAASMTTGSTTANIVSLQGKLSVRVISVRFLIFQLNGAKVIGSDYGDWSTTSSQQLETEFNVRLQNGTVRSLAYPSHSNVSHWVTNVHKGIASLFSLHYPDQTKDRSMSSSTTYTAMEEEVTGRCVNVYDWTPLNEEPSDMVNTRLCHPRSRNRYQLFKTRNFDNCTHLPMYNLVAPAGWRCKPGSAICENVQSRSLVERIELCGDLSGVRDMDILRIELREDWISQPWGAKHHHATPSRVSITQRMILTGKSQIQPSRRGVRNERGMAGGASDDPWDSRPTTGRYQQELLGYTFGQMEEDFVLDDDDDKTAFDQFLNQIKDLRSILFQPTELVKRRASNMRRRLFDRFRSLSPLQLARLTENAQHQLTPQQWSFYIQQMATVGSSATLDILKQLMEGEQITNEDIMALISGFSMFLREPSDHVLGQLLSLLDLKVVRREPDLRQTAMVSLASFFRMACIDRLSAETRFPSQYFNISRDETWPRRLVARLAVEIRQGQSGDRSAALSALNILGHPSLIPVIIPLIEGKADSNPAVRTKAVLALHKLAHHGDPGAIKILHMVYANPSDNYQVRLAAFTLLMLSCPPDHVWQSVAARTWFEPRSHVASFVFTTFDTLASFRSPIRFLQKLSLKARKVLKLTKPVLPGRSANYIWSFEKRRRLLASYLRLETFANKASVFPKEIYGRLNFNLGAVDFDFLEFEIHGHHMESIIADILATDATQYPASGRRCDQRISSAPVEALLARLNVTYPTGQLGEGFFHWTLMESIEKFWSFDGAVVKSLRSYLEAESVSFQNLVWLHQLPLVNVEIRWANSMGFVTEVRVAGQITATLDGSISATKTQQKETVIDSHLNPTVALEVESSIGVQLSGSRIGSVSSSSSSVLLLASIPGRLRLRSTDRPDQRIDIKWEVDREEKMEELIFLHKSHCLDGVCPTSQVDSARAVEWEKMVGGDGAEPDWKKLLSFVSFSWLPDENMGVGWRQFSWQRGKTIRPTVFQFSVQLNRTGKPLEWVMTSGATDLRRTSSIGPVGVRTSQGAMGLPAIEKDEKEVTVEEEANSEGDPSDFIETPSGVQEGVKRIGLSAAAAVAGPSSFSSPVLVAWAWLELPTQIGRALLNMATGQQQLMPVGNGKEQRLGDYLALQWKWTDDDDRRYTNKTGHYQFTIQTDPDQYPGECRLSRSKVNTFDGVEYEPRLVNECQYMVVASTGTEEKLAVLLDRGSTGQNQVLKLMVSDDIIEIDLANKRLAVNRVSIPLPTDENGRSQEVGGFALESPCHGPLLYALNQDNGTLQIQLPIHGMILDISSEDEILIRVRESLGGRVQGLCGDMNGERLFEFRGPRRCVLSSGSLMAAQYQTSDRPHCSVLAFRSSYPNDDQDERILPYHSISNDVNYCPRQEGSPTPIKMPIGFNDMTK